MAADDPETNALFERIDILITKALEAVRARNADLALLYMREVDATVRKLPVSELPTLEDVKGETKDG